MENNNKQCEFIKSVFSQYLDGFLGRNETAIFEEHLSNCAECKGFFEEQRKLTKLLRSLDFRLPAEIADTEFQENDYFNNLNAKILKKIYKPKNIFNLFTLQKLAVAVFAFIIIYTTVHFQFLTNSNQSLKYKNDTSLTKTILSDKKTKSPRILGEEFKLKANNEEVGFTNKIASKPDQTKKTDNEDFKDVQINNAGLDLPTLAMGTTIDCGKNKSVSYNSTSQNLPKRRNFQKKSLAVNYTDEFLQEIKKSNEILNRYREAYNQEISSNNLSKKVIISKKIYYSSKTIDKDGDIKVLSSSLSYVNKKVPHKNSLSSKKPETEGNIEKSVSQSNIITLYENNQPVKIIDIDNYNFSNIFNEDDDYITKNWLDVSPSIASFPVNLNRSSGPLFELQKGNSTIFHKLNPIYVAKSVRESVIENEKTVNNFIKNQDYDKAEKIYLDMMENSSYTTYKPYLLYKLVKMFNTVNKEKRDLYYNKLESIDNNTKYLIRANEIIDK